MIAMCVRLILAGEMTLSDVPAKWIVKVQAALMEAQSGE